MTRFLETKELTSSQSKGLVKLLAQLSDNLTPPTEEDLLRFLQQPHITLIIALDNDEVIGSLTIATYRLLSGKKAWIEDVVVDGTARGKGVGKQLMLFGIDWLREHHYTSVDLTSKSTRIVANRLYQALGFELRQSNLYRLQLH